MVSDPNAHELNSLNMRVSSLTETSAVYYELPRTQRALEAEGQTG